MTAARKIAPEPSATSRRSTSVRMAIIALEEALYVNADLLRHACCSNGVYGIERQLTMTTLQREKLELENGLRALRTRQVMDV